MTTRGKAKVATVGEQIASSLFLFAQKGPRAQRLVMEMENDRCGC